MSGKNILSQKPMDMVKSSLQSPFPWFLGFSMLLSLVIGYAVSWADSGQVPGFEGTLASSMSLIDFFVPLALMTGGALALQELRNLWAAPRPGWGILSRVFVAWWGLASVLMAAALVLFWLVSLPGAQGPELSALLWAVGSLTLSGGMFLAVGMGVAALVASFAGGMAVVLGTWGVFGFGFDRMVQVSTPAGSSFPSWYEAVMVLTPFTPFRKLFGVAAGPSAWIFEGGAGALVLMAASPRDRVDVLVEVPLLLLWLAAGLAVAWLAMGRVRPPASEPIHERA